MTKNVFKRKIGNKVTAKEIKDLQFESPEACDDLKWFIDCIEQPDVLLHLLKNKGWVCYSGERGPSYNCYFLNNDGVLIEQSIRGKNNLPNCIFFSGGRWNVKINDFISDSSKEKYQAKSSSHFSQTFVIMYFLGETSQMIHGNYENNLLQAIKFWKKSLKSDSRLVSLILKRANSYWGRNKEKELTHEVEKICVPLKKRLMYFKDEDLYKYLSYLKLRHVRYVSCKEKE